MGLGNLKLSNNLAFILFLGLIGCTKALDLQTSSAVSLSSMTGGQYIRGNQDNTISWKVFDGLTLGTNPITLHYSLNNGSTWTLMASDLPNSGSYLWSTPGFNSSKAKIRITAKKDDGSTLISESPSTFIIDSTSPLVTLDSLNGGQLLKASSTANIIWTAIDANFSSTPIGIFYSSNGGTSWTAIASAVANTGSYVWTVPNVDSSHYRLRIIATDIVGQITTVSSTSNIKIDKTPPSVTLTSLTGGQALAPSSSQNITWTASDTNFGATPITLEYSADSGDTWTTVASNIANTGSYTWTTPSTNIATNRVRVTATDSAGWKTIAASSTDFIVSTSAPNLTQTAITSPYYSKTATDLTFGGACDSSYIITITGAENTTTTCTAGAWTWQTATVSTDGVREYTFSQTNGVLTTSKTVRWIRDTEVPVISAVVINDGDSYTPSPTVSVNVTTEADVSVRLANAATDSSSCQAQYANNNWQAQTSTTTTYTHVLSSDDGTKKVCVWAKDLAGNISVISPAAGTQDENMDTITYSSGNPPALSTFTVVNFSGGAFHNSQNANNGDLLKISWSVTDVEGLSKNPIYLDYTLDGTTWIPIEAGYGSLSGNPTTYTTDYYGFSAPANTFFRLRIRAKDIAGNTSVEYFSPSFNTYPWSVFAGNRGRGIGGSGKSASVLKASNGLPTFAMNPKNGDIYYVDHQKGIAKVSASTGLVSKITSYANGNITGSGTLNPITSYNGSADVLKFDSNGYLYLITSASNSGNNQPIITRWVIRINPDTLAYTTYMAGGGTHYGDAGTTPDNAFIMISGAFAFDESNSLYFITSCTPGTWTASSTSRLLKVTQNADGTAGAVSIVAGNCVRANPTSGQLATATGFGSTTNPDGAQLTVWDNGNKIYYYPGNGTVVYKIINGTVYTSNIPLNTLPHMAYNPADGLIYSAYKTLKAYAPNISGNDGDTEDVSKQILGTATGPTCADDGTAAADSCMSMNGALISPAGKVFFTDGPSASLASLRYLDENGDVQTLVGAKSYSGNGKAPALTKGMFGGIYYKKSTEALPTEYPEGLYFAEFQGGVFGYFSKALGVSVNLWGNQSGDTPPMATSASVGPGLSFGSTSYASYGDLKAMSFDSSGRPWFKYNSYKLATLDANKQLIYRSSTNSSNWTSIAPGTNPQGYSLARYGGMQNLTFSDNKLFLLGVYTLTSTDPATVKPMLRLWDYDNSTIQHIMGNELNDRTPEQLTAGSLETKPIILSCNNSGCAIQYVPDEDRLYMAEGEKMRYIGAPMTPAQHTLVDVFDATGTISNFIVSEDRKYIFYIESGYLYCRTIDPTDTSSAICKNKNSGPAEKLGPPDGLDTITKGPNQLTWKDNLTLYISTQKGEIYEYLVYH